MGEWEAGESAAFSGLWFVNDKATGKRVCEAASEKEAHEIVSLRKQIETWKEYHAELGRRSARELAEIRADVMAALTTRDATIARLEADFAKVCNEVETMGRECERLEAENAGLREECKASRRWKSWRSMMGGPDQSEVREEWDEAMKATDAAGWLKEAP